MERAHRIHFTVLVSAAAFAAGLMLTALVHLPVPWYFPLRHEWRWVVRPDALAVDWYGRSLFAAAVSVACSCVTWATCAAVPSPRTERPFRWLALWTALLIASTAGLFVYQLSQRVAQPEPIPPDYEAR